MDVVLAALAAVLPVVVALLRGPVARAFLARAARDRYALAYARVADAVADVVADVHQQVVEPARRTNSWDDAAKERAKARALRALEDRWDSDQWRRLREDLGLGVAEAALVLAQKVEGEVLEIKRR